MPAPAILSGRAASDIAATGAGHALSLLFLINTLNFFDRQLLGSLAEPIRKEFLLSDTRFGILATAFTLMYALVGLPMGLLADRGSRPRLIALSTALWSVLTAATGVAQSYAQLVVARLGVGVGEASCAPAGQSLIGDLFPSHRRAFALGVFMLGLPLGVGLSYLLAGQIGARWGWRVVFLAACVPGLLLAALALRMHEPRRGAPDAGGERRTMALFSGYRQVLKVPTLRWIILSGIFHTFNMFAINYFSTAFLQRFHGLPLRQASNVSAVAVGAVGALGLLGGGWLADRLSTRYRRGRLLLSATCMAIAAPCLFLAINQPQGAIGAYVVLMALATITLYVYYATVYAAIQDVVEPQLRGTAVALYFCCMYVLGASLGPLGTGLLSDHFARRAMQAAGATSLTEVHKAIGLHQAMYVTPLLAALAALVLFAAARSPGADLQKARA